MKPTSGEVIAQCEWEGEGRKESRYYDLTKSCRRLLGLGCPGEGNGGEKNHKQGQRRRSSGRKEMKWIKSSPGDKTQQPF